jgi:hypothetical protein
MAPSTALARQRAVALGVSAAAGGILRGVTEARSADTGTEGRRIGDAHAFQPRHLFVEFGWALAGPVR